MTCGNHRSRLLTGQPAGPNGSSQELLRSQHCLLPALLPDFQFFPRQSFSSCHWLTTGSKLLQLARQLSHPNRFPGVFFRRENVPVFGGCRNPRGYALPVQTRTRMVDYEKVGTPDQRGRQADPFRLGSASQDEARAAERRRAADGRGNSPRTPSVDAEKPPSEPQTSQASLLRRTDDCQKDP